MLKLIIWTRWPYRLLILALSFMSAVLSILALLLQKEFIDRMTHVQNLKFLSSLNLSSETLILFAFITFLLSQAFIQLCNYIGSREALVMQGLLAKKLYNKMLTLKVDTLGQKSLGEIVSLYTTDIPGATVFLDQTLPAGASTLFPLLLAPLVLFHMFDTPLWPTVLMLIVISFINTSLAFRQSHFFFKFKQLAGERIGLVNEWIQNIRTLRTLGWTQNFEKKIFEKREIETKNRVQMVTNGQVMNSISSTFTFITNVLTLGFLVYFTNETLTPGQILGLLWLLGVFLTRPFRQMPWFFTFAFDSWTSLKRLEDFFKIENPDPNQTIANLLPLAKKSSLEIVNLNLKIQEHHLLKNISFILNPNELVAVVGEVGSGKSLLLLSLLGETNASWDRYTILGHNIDSQKSDWKQMLSYVPQESFMMSASVKENIVFDYSTKMSDITTVKKSLLACEFDPLGERLTQGIDTEIGERGVNLSGGQKQRLSLARANFFDKDIILLDDAFSALDVETEKVIMEKLILDQWKSKTRVIVTHRLTVLEKVDRVFFMKNGTLSDSGTYSDLCLRNKEFRQFTQTVHQQTDQEIPL